MKGFSAAKPECKHAEQGFLVALAGARVLGTCAPRRKLGPTEGFLDHRAKLRREVRGRTSTGLSPGAFGSIKLGVFGQDGAQGTSAMLFGHYRLEIGRGLVFGFTLTGSPFHEEAVAQAPEHPHDPNAIGVANATSIIVVRYIQPLMGAAFNSPARSVGLEPFLSGQFLRLRTGHQRN